MTIEPLLFSTRSRVLRIPSATFKTAATQKFKPPLCRRAARRPRGTGPSYSARIPDYDKNRRIIPRYVARALQFNKFPKALRDPRGTRGARKNRRQLHRGERMYAAKNAAAEGKPRFFSDTHRIRPCYGRVRKAKPRASPPTRELEKWPLCHCTRGTFDSTRAATERTVPSRSYRNEPKRIEPNRSAPAEPMNNTGAAQLALPVSNLIGELSTLQGTWTCPRKKGHPFDGIHHTTPPHRATPRSRKPRGAAGSETRKEPPRTRHCVLVFCARCRSSTRFQSIG